MTTKMTDYDRAREYLDEVATVAADRRRLKNMREIDDIDWVGTTLEERMKEDERFLIDAQERMNQVGGPEGDALICRYVYLLTDSKLGKAIGYCRSGAYKVLDRGIKAMAHYLPE